MLLAFAARAQLPYQLTRVQEEGGLKTADLVGLAQDSLGFLWTATQTEVQQFDGRYTLRYPFTASIVQLFIDQHNRKWVRTRSALYLFDEVGRHFLKVRFHTGKQAPITAVFQVGRDSVAAFANAKAFLFDATQKSFLLWPKGPAATRYLGSWGNVHFLEHRDSIRQWPQPAGRNASVGIASLLSAIPLSANSLLVSTYQYKTYLIDWSREPAALLFGNDQLLGKNGVVFSAAPLHPGILLLATSQGYASVHLATKGVQPIQMLADGRALKQPASTTLLYRNKQGNIFMNHADGLYLLDRNSQFMQYLRMDESGDSKRWSGDVRHFTEDGSGDIWMATTGGIARMCIRQGRPQKISGVHLRKGWNYPSFRQLLFSGTRLWIGTSGNGVWWYHPRRSEFGRPLFTDVNPELEDAKRLNNAYVWKLLQLANGRLLSITGNDLFTIDPETMAAKKVPVSFKPAVSRSAAQDAEGRIWHGTTMGLFCYDQNFRTLFHLRDSFPDQRIASLFEWMPNRMLVGSKGLYEVRMHRNRVAGFSRFQSIPAARLVYCIQKDAQGFLWLGTDEGIYRLDPKRDKAWLFDKADGVQPQAFNSDGAFLSSTGLLFFGGRNGVNFFRPDRWLPGARSLSPMVLELTAYIGDSAYRQPSRIPYTSRDLDLVFSAPEYQRPFQIRYRYRLRPDASWISAGFNNRVRISGLQPGNYAVQVSASFDGTTWFDGTAAATFTILKPWWQTNGFRLALLITLGWMAWLLAGLRRRRKEAAVLRQTVEYFTKTVPAPTSVSQILWDIAHNCISRLGFEDCVIYLLDNNTNRLVQKAAIGPKSPMRYQITNPIEIKVGEGITGTVAATGKPLLVSDTRKDSRYIVDDQHRLSELAVPILHNGQLIGVIDSEHSRKNFFTRHHLHTLQNIASLSAANITMAMAVENAAKAAADLQILNARMLEAKFTNLRLQMNPHFLFNILTTIQYLIVSQQVGRATRYVDVFATYLRSLLNHAEDTVVPLKEELELLALYVELESLCLDESFVWEVRVSDALDEAEVLVPFMILQPFVENAIHHGLVHRVGEKRFFISVEEQQEDCIRCIVEDNGVGRVASAALEHIPLPKTLHQSKGIGIVEKRLALLAEKTGKTAFLTIEDLYQEGTATGTRVCLVIPGYLNDEI